MSLFERTPASLFLTVHGTDALTVVLEYDRRRFDAAVIDRMLTHFTTFLSAVAPGDSSPRLMEIPILSQEETDTMARRLNTAAVHSRPDSCIHHLIEIQTALDTGAVAVTDHRAQRTYGELNEYANRIAHYLIQRGAAPEERVVVLLDQDMDLIAVLLGVLKSGAAYVPVDPEYPDERVGYIIADAAPAVIITTIDQEDRLPPGNRTVVLLDVENIAIGQMPAHNPRTHVTPRHMAYIIYTSGSTGQPKGVVVEHGSLVAFTRSAAEIYEIRPDDRMLQFASISFDASAEEIYPTLFSGATLVMKPRDELHTPSRFCDFCRERGVTILDLPTSYWHLLADEVDTLSLPEQVRLVIIGGDEAHGSRVEKWNRHAGNDIRLLNTYGPTEATVAVTWADLSTGKSSASFPGKVSIGTPFPTVNLCILNHFGQPALPGTRGELCIGGTQTARGYLNREELTQNAFVKLPGLHRETTFFKTGDQVELTAEGDIVFHGRVDRQIKIRGFRVEPGEIEGAARNHPAIAQCAVSAFKQADGTVITGAFLEIRPRDRENFKLKEFKTWLSSKLPRHMMPSRLIPVDALPLTPSGKIDYPALVIPSGKALDDDSPSQAHDFSAPCQAELKDIWETILGTAVTRCDESFFDVGGSSLHAIKLITAIEKKFKVSLPIIAIFKTPTIEGLAQKIEREIQLSRLKTRRLISGTGNKPPIILVGNSVGSAQAYKNADLKGHPFYHAPIFIHFYAAGEKGALDLDVWQLARKCIKDITLFFPTGPYIIMGECLNAVVAHEVASQLINMNKTVELLVILDENWQQTPSSPESKPDNSPKPSFFRKQFQDITRDGPMVLPRKIIKRITFKVRKTFAALDPLREKVYSRLNKSAPESVQFRLMENIFYKAYARHPYVPIPYHGRVLMLDSKEWVETYNPQLRTFYKGEVFHKKVAWYHPEWFKPKSIETVITAINEMN